MNPSTFVHDQERHAPLRVFIVLKIPASCIDTLMTNSGLFRCASKPHTPPTDASSLSCHVNWTPISSTLSCFCCCYYLNVYTPVTQRNTERPRKAQRLSSGSVDEELSSGGSADGSVDGSLDGSPETDRESFSAATPALVETPPTPAATAAVAAATIAAAAASTYPAAAVAAPAPSPAASPATDDDEMEEDDDDDDEVQPQGKQRSYVAHTYVDPHNLKYSTR